MRLAKMATPRRKASVTSWLAALPLAAHLSFAWAAFFAVTAIRFSTVADAAFPALYVVPVSFLVWFVSPRVGTASAFLSTAVLLWFDHSRGSIQPYWRAVFDLGLFLFVVFILKDVRALYERERDLSRHDPLTGLFNRRAFLEVMQAEHQRMGRHPSSTTIVYMDLDNFKQLNDSQGHTVGDNLLVEVARVVLSSIRGIDVAARLGGDEFALLLPETDQPAARVVVEKLRQRLLEVVKARDWPVTVSVGAVTYKDIPSSAQKIIERADEVMYSVKQSGKNRAEFR